MENQIRLLEEQIKVNIMNIDKLKNFQKYIDQIQKILDGQDPKKSDKILIIQNHKYKHL